MRTLLAVLVSLVALAGCGKPKTDLEAGIAAFEKKNYLASQDAIQSWAEYGDPRAQLYMGKLVGSACHLFGGNFERCEWQSLDWYRKAADQGNLEAQAFLGQWLLMGVGLRQVSNPVEAEKWLLKASDQGDLRSMDTLGLFYGHRKQAGDSVMAYGLISAAANRGADYAQGHVIDVANHLSLEERAEGRTLAGRLSAPGAKPSEILKEWAKRTQS